MREKLIKYLINGGIIVTLAAIIIILVIGAGNLFSKDEIKQETSQTVTETKEKKEKKKETISVETIEDGLREIGILTTQEYYFTDIVTYESTKTWLNFSLPFTESSYMASYDGVVTVGIDFTKITIESNDFTRTITVSLPEAELISTEIDYDSFRLYSEKTGFANPISVSDVNDSLKELKQRAETKAIEKGILTKGNESAKVLIENFINSILEGKGYTITFEV